MSKQISEAQRELLELIERHRMPVEYDDYGQILVYTGIWEDEDGNLSPNPPKNDEDEYLWINIEEEE